MSQGNQFPWEPLDWFCCYYLIVFRELEKWSPNVVVVQLQSQSAKVICFNIACPQNHSTVLEISPYHLEKPTEHNASSIIHTTVSLSFNLNPDIKHACEMENKSYYMPVQFFNGRQDVSILLVMTSVWESYF